MSPVGQVDAVRFLDHKRIAAGRCVADLLRVLGVADYEQGAVDRITDLLIDTLPEMIAEESE